LRAFAGRFVVQHDQFFGHDFRGVVVYLVLILPLGRFEFAREIDLCAFGQVGFDDLGQFVETNDLVPFGRVCFLTGRLVQPLFAGRHRKLGKAPSVMAYGFGRLA
jgi:hypothetical protein